MIEVCQNYEMPKLPEQSDPHLKGRSAWRSVPGAAPPDHGGHQGNAPGPGQGNARDRQRRDPALRRGGEILLQ